MMAVHWRRRRRRRCRWTGRFKSGPITMVCLRAPADVLPDLAVMSSVPDAPLQVLLLLLLLPHTHTLPSSLLPRPAACSPSAPLSLLLHLCPSVPDMRLQVATIRNTPSCPTTPSGWLPVCRQVAARADGDGKTVTWYITPKRPEDAAAEAVDFAGRWVPCSLSPPTHPLQLPPHTHCAVLP